MAVELLGNGGSTTLSAAVDGVVTSLPVTSAATFPTGTGQYRIRVGDELMIVTGGIGTTTWTVVRGAESTAASHASGATVRHVLTGGALKPMLVPAGGAAGNVLTKSTAADYDAAWAAAAGGGGSSWTLEKDLPLTSLTDWTAEGTGTWTVEVDRIRQSAVNTNVKRLRYTGMAIPAACVVQAEVRTDSSATADNRVGLTVGIPTAGGTGGVAAHMRGNGTHLTEVYYEVDALSAHGTTVLPATVAYGTYVTLRMHVTDGAATIYVNGARLTTLRNNVGGAGQRPWLGLYSYNADSSWRNLKVWGPTLPA